MRIANHGGHCCGVDHIYGFEYLRNRPVVGLDAGSQQRVDEFKRSVNNWKYHNASRLLEACLTDHQMVGWAPYLQEAGFKLVTRFRNSNSENTVNVLHLLSARPTTKTARGKLPRLFKWEDK